jgi:2',3'-cyclic-nucleotide 2'-phosphodiesterase (5'-nucleotidase family)
MKSYINLLLVLFILGVSSCHTPRSVVGSKKDDGRLELVFVQVNDVYEIAPLEGGKTGGMARVATLKKQQLRGNPNTLLVMAGDFVSPSIYNSLPFQGKPIRGKQMIEAMNSAGMDIAVFGNHEFDIRENELQDRLNESDFLWVSSNAFHSKNGAALHFTKTRYNITTNVPESYIMNLKDSDGTTVRVGFMGLTLPFNKAEFVSYTDPLAAAKSMYASLKDSMVDAVVAITHQAVEDDSILAREIPGLAVILGGHEHNMQFKKVGNVYITKAHANAKSAYVVRLLINKSDKSLTVTPELKMLDESVALDSATNVVVKKWMDIGDSNFATLGFDAKNVVIATGDPLDGRETSIRSGTTNLTKLVANAMADASPEAQVSIYNSGSIRLDDILVPPVTQYDIIRSLPFGGGIVEADVKGSLLIQVLDVGRKNRNIGGYLQYTPVEFNVSSGKWMLGQQPLDPGKVYRVAFTDFLITGKEANLGFLTRDNPGMVKVYDALPAKGDSKGDIRLAIVRYLQKNSK